MKREGRAGKKSLDWPSIKAKIHEDAKRYPLRSFTKSSRDPSRAESRQLQNCASAVVILPSENVGSFPRALLVEEGVLQAVNRVAPLRRVLLQHACIDAESIHLANCDGGNSEWTAGSSLHVGVETFLRSVSNHLLLPWTLLGRVGMTLITMMLCRWRVGA